MELIFIGLMAPLANLEQAKNELLQKAPENKISHANWADFPYKPEVSFWAGWNRDGLLLHFKVKEQHIVATHTALHSPAYEDSCVEFFFSPGSDNNYYNLEVNCVGSMLYHHKTAEGIKTTYHDEVLEKIQTLTSLPKFSKQDIKEGGTWELTIFMPKEMLPEAFLVSGKEFTANFYKLGGKTRELHYLSWSPIESVKPNFHTPQYFGKVKLQ